MSALTLAAIVLLATAALAVFDLLALRYGADSRELLGDDRRRRIG